MTFRIFDISAFLRLMHIETRTPQISIANTTKVIRVFFLRVHQRQQLLALSDHALKDIGLTRAEAMAEASKPFWKE